MLIYVMMVSLILPKGEKWPELLLYLLPAVWALGFIIARIYQAIVVIILTKDKHTCGYYTKAILMFWSNTEFTKRIEKRGFS